MIANSDRELSHTMTSKNQLGLLVALIFIVAIFPACNRGGSGTDIDKANKLVDEGNAAVREARNHLSEAEQLKQKMLTTYESQFDEARSTARDAIAAYEKTEAKCKEAAAKYEEASRLKLSDKLKEYLALKVKEYNKRAELVQTAKGVPQALIDSQNSEGWIDKANSVNEQVNQLAKEADDLSTRADKIQKDNPNIFKS